MTHTHDGFSSVDEQHEAQQFIAYLDEADRQPNIIELRRAIAERLDLRPTDALLDVGCGTGTALFELAGSVARAVGVDLSEEMLEVARSRTRPGVELLHADATALPFEDATFDAYRAERIYQHLADPLAALREARRVLAPGGRLVVADPDWGGLLVDLDDDGLLRRALAATLASRPSATVARRLRRLALDAGFGDVAVVPMLSVMSDRETATRMLLSGLIYTDAAAAELGEQLDELRTQLDSREPFLAAVPIFIVSARID
jgi:ubiquinone/menaquinone biosynthesis C-methylase UbiE